MWHLQRRVTKTYTYVVYTYMRYTMTSYPRYLKVVREKKFLLQKYIFNVHCTNNNVRIA